MFCVCICIKPILFVLHLLWCQTQPWFHEVSDAVKIPFPDILSVQLHKNCPGTRGGVKGWLPGLKPRMFSESSKLEFYFWRWQKSLSKVSYSSWVQAQDEVLIFVRSIVILEGGCSMNSSGCEACRIRIKQQTVRRCFSSALHIKWLSVCSSIHLEQS